MSLSHLPSYPKTTWKFPSFFLGSIEVELPTLEEVAVGEGRFSRLVRKTKGAKKRYGLFLRDIHIILICTYTYSMIYGLHVSI